MGTAREPVAYASAESTTHWTTSLELMYRTQLARICHGLVKAHFPFVRLFRVCLKQKVLHSLSFQSAQTQQRRQQSDSIRGRLSEGTSGKTSCLRENPARQYSHYKRTLRTWSADGVNATNSNWRAGLWTWPRRRSQSQACEESLQNKENVHTSSLSVHKVTTRCHLGTYATNLAEKICWTLQYF